MTARDDAMEAIRKRALHMQDANLLDETCDSILAAVEPIIRADEREKIIRAIQLRADAWRRDGYLSEADDLLQARQIVIAREEQP